MTCRGSPSPGGPSGPAAIRTATSARSWERTSCACSLVVRDALFRGAERVADASLEGVGRALDQEPGGGRGDHVVPVQREPALLDVDSAHPPEEGLPGRGAGLFGHLVQ